MVQMVAIGLAIISMVNIAIWLHALYSIRSSIKCMVRLKNTHSRRHGKRSISIIIPARNEEETLPLLLKSLINQEELGFTEIIVVDDNSTDNTANIVKEYMRKYENIKYIKINKIPCGWAVKPYLYYIGYKYSSGDILFFIDGDTWITSSNLLSKIVDAVLETNGIVSLSPIFMCKTIRCKLVETLLTTFSHAYMGFNKVYDRNNKLAWYYGCCWAIKREIYEELGSHKIVKESIVEDRDFAEYAKRNGYTIKIIYTHGYVVTKWYDKIYDTINVLTRVLRRHGIRRTKALIDSILIFLSYYIPVITSIYSLIFNFQILIPLSILQYIYLVLCHIYGTKLNGYNRLYSVVAPLLGVVLSIGLLKASLAEKIYWKDRIVEEPLRMKLLEK